MPVSMQSLDTGCYCQFVFPTVITCILSCIPGSKFLVSGRSLGAGGWWWKQTEGQTGLVLTVTPAMVYMLDNMLVTPVK